MCASLGALFESEEEFKKRIQQCNGIKQTLQQLKQAGELEQATRLYKHSLLVTYLELLEVHPCTACDHILEAELGACRPVA